ncbi:MAG: UbiA family prenyltransferase [Acidobacteriota bacterium]
MPAVQETAISAHRRRKWWFLHPLSCIRLGEVLVLQGTPLFGALFSMGSITRGKLLDLLMFAAASFCLVAHVFVLNDWCGASTDLRDPNRAARVFTARGIGRREAGCVCVLLLALSLLLLVPFGPTPLLIALALAILSALYSAPLFPIKGVPLLSSVLHLIGGLLHFLLGYSLFHALDWRSIEIGSFFALTFVAGHLTQEVRDYESDFGNQIRTNAVKFGPARCFAAAFLVFTLADVLLVVMATRGVVPRTLVLAGGLYPLHLWWSLRTSVAGFTFKNIRQLQVRYRTLYAIIGLTMIAMVVQGG